MKENIENKNIALAEDKNTGLAEDKQHIQVLLDKYLAGETSNEEEELLRNYFDEHGDDIPEEWKSFRALFCFVGFEKLNFLTEEDSGEEEIAAKEKITAKEEAIVNEFGKESNNEVGKESDNEVAKGNDKPQKAEQRSLHRYIAISAAAAIALILTITGIRSISNHPWGDTQPECYAVIDGKVYTNPEKVHDEALDALQGIGTEGQDDAFEALDMMQ